MKTLRSMVWVPFVAIAVVVSAGCGGTTAGSFQSAATTLPLALRNYDVVKHGLRAEACSTKVLGLGIGDVSYAAAIAKIHEQVDKMKLGVQYQLVNVVDDWTFEFYFIAWKNCTVVSADVVVLREPVYEIAGRSDGKKQDAAVTASDADSNSREYHQQGCDKGSAGSCYKLGEMYYTAKGGAEDQEAAKRFYTRACELGSPQGCSNAGAMWRWGKGGPPDFVQARDFYSRACDRGDAENCYYLGTMYQKGEGGKEDLAKAKELYRRACVGGYIQACSLEQ
jgi:hypothetical protein